MNDNESNDIDDLIKSTYEQLDRQADGLSTDTTNKLDKARRIAVLEAERKALNTRRHWFFMPALAASILGIAVVLTMNVNSPSTRSIDADVAALPLGDSVPLINDDFELMEEDLEFYLWLEESTPS